MLIVPPSGQEFKSTVVSEEVQWYSQCRVSQQSSVNGEVVQGGQSLLPSD